MKILFIFIIITIFINCFNIKEKFNHTYFCNKKEACTILQENHLWYLNKMNKKEKKVRGIIGDSVLFYCSKFLDFKESEKYLLEKCVNECTIMADNRGIDLKGKWRFILCDGLEDNMPHTIGNCIVVNRQFLKLSENRICRTLLHEIVHVLQKENYKIFSEIYKRWGWKRVEMILTKYHSENGRMNPDSWDLWEWKNVVPFVILKGKKGLDDINVIGITYEEDDFDLNQWKEYNKKFNVTQNYHPNEISAILLRDYIVDGRKGWAINSMIPLLTFL